VLKSNLNQWDLINKLFVYKQKPNEKLGYSKDEIVGRMENEKENGEEIEFKTKTREEITEIWNDIAKKHNENKYKETIVKFVDGITKEVKGITIKDILTQESTERYSKKFTEIKNGFFINAQEKENAHTIAYKEIISKTGEELNALKSLIEDTKVANESYSEKEEISKLTESIHNRYCNIEWANLDVNKNEFELEKYKKLSNGFKEGVSIFAEKKLALLEKNNQLTPYSLEELKSDIKNKYEKIAKIDGKDHTISLEDMGDMGTMSKYQAADYKFKSREAAEASFEASYLMNYKQWEDECHNQSIQLLNEINGESLTSNFIELVNKYSEKEITEYGDAVDYFKKTVEAAIIDGPKTFYKVIKVFKEDINKDLNLDFESSGIYSGLVKREYKMLMNGITSPEKEGENMVIEFIKKDKSEREEMLQGDDKNKLFRAIRNMQVHYQEIFDEKEGNSGNKETVRWSSKPEDPSKDDETARAKALVLIANKAEWTVNNHSETDKFKKNSKEGGGSLKEKLSQTMESENYTTGLSFKFNHAVVDRKYVSSITQNTMGNKKIAMGAIQGWAGVVVGLNMLNDLAQEGSWEDKITLALTNPYSIGGVAVIYGLNKYKKNPKAMKLLTGSDNEKLDARVSMALDDIKEEVEEDKDENVASFIRDENEFKMMDELEKGDIEGLLRNAEERRRDKNELYPEITKKDIEDYSSNFIPEGNSRTRYLFYKKILGRGDEKPNIEDVKTVSQNPL